MSGPWTCNHIMQLTHVQGPDKDHTLICIIERLAHVWTLDKQPQAKSFLPLPSRPPCKGDICSSIQPHNLFDCHHIINQKLYFLSVSLQHHVFMLSLSPCLCCLCQCLCIFQSTTSVFPSGTTPPSVPPLSLSLCLRCRCHCHCLCHCLCQCLSNV